MSLISPTFSNMYSRLSILILILLFTLTIKAQKVIPEKYALEIRVNDRILVDKILVQYTTRSGDEKRDSILTKNNSALFHLSSFKPGVSELEVAFRGKLSGKTFSRNIPFFLAAEDMVVYVNEQFEVDSLRGETVTAYSKVNENIVSLDKKAKELMMQEVRKVKLFSEMPDSINRKVNAIRVASKKEKGRVYLDFVKHNPSSPFVVPVLEQAKYSYFDFPEEFEDALSGLSPSIKASSDYKDLVVSIHALRLTAIGQPAPDFTQADTTGKMVKLSSFRGKYVLVDFWASWCGPCRQENPFLVKAFRQYSSKNFTIVSVSLDDEDGRKKWIDAIHKDGLTWTHLSDLASWKNKAAVLYGIESIPANFLIDPSGKILAKNLRGEELLEKLEQILK